MAVLSDRELDIFLVTLAEELIAAEARHPGHSNQKVHGRRGYLSVNDPAVKEAAAEIHAGAVAAEPAITADMKGIAAASGGELVGLDYRVKSLDSIERKLATDPDYASKKMPLDERKAKLKDANRYTVQLDDANYDSGVRTGIRTAEAQGYTVTTSNAWKNNRSGYAGEHATLRKAGQPPVELQFHTKRTYTAKEIGGGGKPASHVLYAKLRTARSPAARARIRKQIEELWAPIRAGAPAGVFLLP